MNDADRARLGPDRYPVHRTVQLRSSDVDRSGYVGSQALGRVFEEARYSVRRSIDHPQAHHPDHGFVLARVVIDLREPVAYPGEVEVVIAIGRVGRSSFDYVSAIFQAGRCRALSDATVAVRNRRTGTGCVLEPSFHEALAHLGLVQTSISSPPAMPPAAHMAATPSPPPRRRSS